jgi:hypothetical protein
MFMVFVFTEADLSEAFGITGNGGAVVGQVILFRPAFSLKLKETLPSLFSNRGEKLTASLGRASPCG